jgi:hypothetical protein
MARAVRSVPALPNSYLTERAVMRVPGQCMVMARQLLQG